MKLQLDMAISNKSELKTFKSIAAKLKLKIKIICKNGPAGGWPIYQIKGKPKNIKKYLYIHCGGDKQQAMDLFKS